MEDYTDRYGSHFMKLIDRHVTMKEFEFDQMLLTPTAEDYRALVEQAKIEINPKIMSCLLEKWFEGAIENLSFFATAVAVYARSISGCTRRKGTGGGCLASVSKEQHHLPKCIMLPRDVAAGWGYMKRYVVTGGAVCA